MPQSLFLELWKMREICKPYRKPTVFSRSPPSTVNQNQQRQTISSSSEASAPGKYCPANELLFIQPRPYPHPSLHELCEFRCSKKPIEQWLNCFKNQNKGQVSYILFVLSCMPPYPSHLTLSLQIILPLILSDSFLLDKKILSSVEGWHNNQLGKEGVGKCSEFCCLFYLFFRKFTSDNDIYSPATMKGKAMGRSGFETFRQNGNRGRLQTLVSVERVGVLVCFCLWF